MTIALKSICFFTAFLGIVTAGVCIWVIAAPVKWNVQKSLHVISAKWDGGDASKIGIATAVLMIIIGIAAFFINLEKRFIFFIAAFFVTLIIAIAFMSLSVKYLQDLKKTKEARNTIKNLPNFSGAYNNGIGGRGGYGRNDINSIIDDIFPNDVLDSIMTRLNILVAVGAIDSIVLLISIIVFYLKRPKSSSRNVIQMERTL